MSTHDDLLALMLSLGGVTHQEWCVCDSVGSRYVVFSLEGARRFRELNYLDPKEDGEEDPLNPRVQVHTIITWPNGAMYHSPWRDVPDEGHGPFALA
jgi:hypothetical protein